MASLEMDHIYLEQRYLRKLDSWIRFIGTKEMTVREVAHERREIIQSFIQDELPARDTSLWWDDIRQAQRIVALKDRLDVLLKANMALEGMLESMHRQIVELRKEKGA